ncbi:MAG: flagellar hook-basal body complex protein FliE [Firmicutes bacterium]|nr:flagellar hook-basal body complex protein FliE [Bacillota bacterium]
MRIDKGLPELTKINTKMNTNLANETDLDFSQVLKTALYTVNNRINQAEQAGVLLASGEMDFHNAMIITEKANLALQLTMAIRNKIVEAYQEIMRMQV